MPLNRKAPFGDWAELTVNVIIVLAVVFLCASGCGRSSTKTSSPQPPTNKDSSAGDEATKDGTAGTTQPQPVDGDSTASLDLGKKLYTQHCAACHGEQGDGKGVAAAYLFPKPRDFRAGRFRLVSTTNGIPTLKDIEAVLQRGMPGSSMPPWAHLSQGDRKMLAKQVIRLRGEGARDHITKILKEEDDEIDQEEVEDFVKSKTTPGKVFEIPVIGQSDPESIARGKELYMKACVSCHGQEGRGDGQQAMIDAEGLPTRPRDLTLGIYKGNHDPASVFQRIALGMPGSPMPSSNTLKPQHIIDMVHFVRSLSDEKTRQAAVLKRQHLVAKRIDHVSDEFDAKQWDNAEPVRLKMVPLWWRDNADPDLQVQAVHDGKSIALRISWRDETKDRHAARSESFEDAVAMEIYRGDAEPFIGMGDPRSPIDVWYWDADRQGEPVTVEDLYPNTVVDLFPFSETVVTSAELDRKGARTADQPEISLPARASGNPITPTSGKSGASSLTAGGPGSVTFRIPKSQLVTAHGQWSDGRWTIVMTRSLAVESETDGVALQPGDKTSVAFAVWDGSQQDRDGKKLITIWHDLDLEK